MPRPIPFLDLRAQNAALREALDRAIGDRVDAADFIGGPAVADFEAAFAAYCEAEAAVGVASGTDALELALRALGLGDGDEVLTTPVTFVATAEAIAATGARVGLVDVDPDSGLMDPAALVAAVGPRTRAIVPVHLYGTPVDMDGVLEVARAHDLKVIEDAAQAHGARWRGRRVGALGDAGGFSFYPTKNLGGFGDGGAVVSRDRSLAERVRRLGDHGRVGHFEHAVVGRNSRLDALQAAVLQVKLGHLDAWNDRRRALATRYREGLERAGVAGRVRPAAIPDGAEPVHHLFAVVVEADRDGLMASLEAAGIQSRIHYPVPIHRQPAFAALSDLGGWPHAEAFCAKTLSLPLHPGMADADVDRVCEAIAAWAAGQGQR
jgi:dTDP-4-amino-4,6-dideoxygalactose transaminase